MLGLGLGVTRQSYPAEENPIVFFRQSNFSAGEPPSGPDTITAQSVQGNLTIQYGQTAPGSVYDDWVKCTYDTTQADPGGTSGIRFKKFVSPADNESNAFIDDYDDGAGYYIAVAMDVYLETGFDGTTDTAVRASIRTGGRNFDRDIDGVGGAGTAVIPQGQHVRDFGSRSDDNTGLRWAAMNGTAPNGHIFLEFDIDSDYPEAGAVFYVRNLRVAIASEDLGFQIPNPPVSTITYESDFSSTVDGWSTHLADDSALAAGVTAHGFDDLLEWSWSADESGSGYIKKTLDSRVDQHGSKLDKNTTLQREIVVNFDVFYEDNTDPPVPPTGITVGVGGFTDLGSGSLLTINEWNTRSVTITLDDASTDTLYLGIGSANDLPDAGDKIYFKNIRVSFPTIDPEP